MYKLRKATEVPGVKRPYIVGWPDNQQPNICITTSASSRNYTTLNARVLRQALLADEDATEKLLGLKVVDVHKIKNRNKGSEVKSKPPVNRKTPKKKPTPKKNTASQKKEEPKKEAESK